MLRSHTPTGWLLSSQGPVEFANVALFEELSRVAETENVNAITSAGYVYGQVRLPQP